MQPQVAGTRLSMYVCDETTHVTSGQVPEQSQYS